MIKVTFEFLTLELLVAFVLLYPCTSYVIIPNLLQITFNCKEKEWLSAIATYHGKVISKQLQIVL